MRASSTTLIHQEKEREFLAALEADTGRTLDQWMEAIRAEALGDRNAIIDWLRRQGFRFSRASWLERVHHNGGRPIYADRPVVERAAVRRPPAPRAETAAVGNTLPRPSAGVLGTRLTAPSPPPARREPQEPKAAGDAYAAAAANIVPLNFSDPLSPEITSVTAKAKAYRPLADFLLREIVKAVPGTRFAARGQSIVVAKDREFAMLAVSARELKLHVGAAAVSLTDARQVDEPLLARLRAAAGTSS